MDDDNDDHDDAMDDDKHDTKVEEALALGADPNMRGHDGSTALMQVSSLSSPSYFVIL